MLFKRVSWPLPTNQQHKPSFTLSRTPGELQSKDPAEMRLIEIRGNCTLRLVPSPFPTSHTISRLASVLKVLRIRSHEQNVDFYMLRLIG
jgi:hypothetical protein